MSGLMICRFCDRLYSRHSLPLHEPKCPDNPSARRQSSAGKSKKWMKSNRPRTRSMSRRAEVEFRICFVCGRHFNQDEINQHERRCFDDWWHECERLSGRFVSRAPEPLLIPSVDGTQDTRRLNDHAEGQAAKAQMLRCRRCGSRVPLRAADDHSCSQFDPPVEFFF